MLLLYLNSSYIISAYLYYLCIREDCALSSHTTISLEEQLILLRKKNLLPEALKLPNSIEATLPTNIEMVFAPIKGPHSPVVAAYFPKPFNASISEELTTITVS